MSTEFFKVKGIQVANIKSSSDIAFFGVAVKSGSNYETPEIAGISHFAEHLFFKGTKKRNWKQINEDFAKLGVNNNAYTSNNEVLYHTTCPKENIEPVIELTLDMFFNSTIPEEELEKERGVIVEEKKMYDDDPKAAFSSAVGNAFFTWEIGHDTIGTFETIKSISRDQVIRYTEDKTNLSNFIFVCSGDINSVDLKKYIADNMPEDHKFYREKNVNSVKDGFWTDIINKPGKIKFLFERENITQSSIDMLTKGLSREDTDYYDSVVLYKALGGGMYSKLFSRIREELGLCYSIGMQNFSLAYPERSLTDLYGYVSEKNVDSFMEESEKVIKDVVKNGLDQNIFDCAKTDYLALILRGTETSAGKAHYLVNKYIYGKRDTVEEVIEKIRDVKIETCNELAGRLLNVDYNWAVMNPKGE